VIAVPLPATSLPSLAAFISLCFIKLNLRTGNKRFFKHCEDPPEKINGELVIVEQLAYYMGW